LFDAPLEHLLEEGRLRVVERQPDAPGDRGAEPLDLIGPHRAGHPAAPAANALGHSPGRRRAARKQSSSSASSVPTEAMASESASLRRAGRSCNEAAASLRIPNTASTASATT